MALVEEEIAAAVTRSNNIAVRKTGRLPEQAAAGIRLERNGNYK